MRLVQARRDGLRLADLATDAVVEGAYAWRWTRRKDGSPRAEVWRFRQDWAVENVPLREALVAGTSAVGRLDRVTRSRKGGQEDSDSWSARAALVMQAVSPIGPQHLPLAEHGPHLQGHGGAP